LSFARHISAKARMPLLHPNLKGTVMKRDDLFPSKYAKCADLKGKPRVVEIERAPTETLKNPKGEEQRKAVLYFKGMKKTLPLNLTNFDAVAEIVGSDETEDWPGTKVELFPSTTMMGGKITDCIRIRRPRQEGSPITPPPAEPLDELDQEIPF
jgi:hypothetical protein